MFSGIVETTADVTETWMDGGVLRIKLNKPSDFNDISVGDSIACNGVCLTVEDFDDSFLQFAIAAETLQVTGWSGEKLLNSSLNLERSLRFGDRVHGHMVTGHVDEMGQVKRFEEVNGSWMLDVSHSEKISPLIWKKGSVAINGVSLTVNAADAGGFSVCLIPETIKRTNLKNLSLGDAVTVEADNMARGLIHLRNSYVKELS